MGSLALKTAVHGYLPLRRNVHNDISDDVDDDIDDARVDSRIGIAMKKAVWLAQFVKRRKLNFAVHRFQIAVCFVLN